MTIASSGLIPLLMASTGIVDIVVTMNNVARLN